MNLDAYLARIRYDGALTPDLDVLRSVVFQHAANIAFENLNPFLGLPVSLELADVQRKLIDEQRGGYCFEQNLLLSEALRTMGFQVTGLAARVLWMRPEDSIAARTHMLLRVKVADRDYLVDVGFGGLTLTGALELTPDVEQRTPHEVFRLSKVNDDWFMQAKLGEEWRTLYRFDLQEQHAIDYQVVNYFVSTHSNSQFVHSVLAARSSEAGRYALRNREFTFRPKHGAALTRSLRDADEICAVLRNEFGIKVPNNDKLVKRLTELP